MTDRSSIKALIDCPLLDCQTTAIKTIFKYKDYDFSLLLLQNKMQLVNVASDSFLNDHTYAMKYWYNSIDIYHGMLDDEEGWSLCHSPGYFLVPTISNPCPSLFPPTHYPSNLFPSLFVNLPWPSFLSSEYQPSQTEPSRHLQTPNPCFLPLTNPPSQVSPFLYFMSPLAAVSSLLESSPSYSHSSPLLYLPRPCFLPAKYSPSQTERYPGLDQISLPLPLGRSPSHCPSYLQPSFSKENKPLPWACYLKSSPSQYQPWALMNLPSPLGTPFMNEPMQQLPSGQISFPFPCGSPSCHSLFASQMSPTLLTAQAEGSLVPTGASKLGLYTKFLSFCSIQ